MKFLNGKIGLMLRFSAVVTALLLGQQAMAVGTAADTDILNEVTVNYDVGSVGQTATDSVIFKVDRRVDFTLLPVSTGDLEGVTPGESDAWVDFLLTNTSNATLDFLLAAPNTAPGDPVDGSGNDDADMSNIRWGVSGDLVSGTNPDPTFPPAAGQFVDELPPDEAIRIRVWADADGTMSLGEIAGVDLTATAREAGTSGVLDGVITYGGADDPDTVQSVAADADNDGVEVSVDGFIVEDAVISVAKDFTVIDEGLGTHLIPGALVQYTIAIENSGSAAATNVDISDDLNTQLTLVLGAFGGSDFQIVINGGAPTFCTAAADADTCAATGQVLTFDDLTITAATGPATPGTLVVTFQVRIRGTGAT
ncbi:MAG: hypothetical protein GY783_16600 [Gammaproteobacteria bacterium]|nr:hypothetical protein [Gammaproteobacteria bacterium]